MQELVIGSIGFVLFLILGIRFCTIDGNSDNIASSLKKLGIQQHANHSHHSGLNAELIALGAMSLITAAVFLIDLMLLVSLTRLRDSFKAMVRSRA